MKFPVCPELPTASVGSSQAPPAAVDNSAPSAIRPESTYKSGNVVQTNGATSQITSIYRHNLSRKLSYQGIDLIVIALHSLNRSRCIDLWTG